MKRIKRASIVLIAVGLIVSLTMVLPASARVERNGVEVLSSEFVVATMDSAGDIEEVQVFNQLSLNGDGTVTVKEEAAFEDVGGFQGVKSFTKPSVEDGFIVWPEITVNGPANVVATTKLSETSVEEARTRIPLDTKFKYWFDGSPVTDLETITGKDGRFKMELTMRNTSKEKTPLRYEDPATGEMVTEMVDTYLPLVILPYDWYFDNSIFFNLECDPTGLVVYMPDFYTVGWSIPLFPPATDESHTIWVAADVKNFQMPPLTLSVNFVFPETNQANPLTILGPAIEQLYGGIKQVNEGIGSPTTDPSLLFGITAVDAGLQKLASSEGLPAAATAINTQMIPGVDQMRAGTDQLISGNAQITGGLQGISAGIGAATTEGTLLFGLNEVMAGMDYLLTVIGNSATEGTLLYAAYGIAGGLQSLRAALGPGGTIQSSINFVYDDLTTASASHAPYGQPSLQFVIQNSGLTAPQIAGLNGIINGVLSPVLTGINTGLTTIANVSIGDGSAAGLQYAANALYGGLVAIAAGIGSTGTEGTALWGLDQVAQGLNLIKNQYIGSSTTSSSLLYGTAQIQYGLNKVKYGLASGDPNNPALKEGLIELTVGVDTAVAGLGSAGTPDTALYATSQITGGLTQLSGGATQMEDGLAMIMSNLNMTEAELEVIKKRGEEFDHFLGRAEGEENAVRFVYQSKPTYNYETGSSTSWIVAIVISLLVALMLVAGGILLARRSTA